jgi:hypothetical protein
MNRISDKTIQRLLADGTQIEALLAADLRDARATIAEQAERITQLEARLALAEELAEAVDDAHSLPRAVIETLAAYRGGKDEVFEKWSAQNLQVWHWACPDAARAAYRAATLAERQRAVEIVEALIAEPFHSKNREIVLAHEIVIQTYWAVLDALKITTIKNPIETRGQNP